MNEYPIGTIVITDTFKEGDRIIPIEQARNGYLNFFKATEIDVTNKSDRQKEFLKIIIDQPESPVDAELKPCQLRYIKPCSIFSYSGFKYRKTSRECKSADSPRYIGIQGNNIDVCACMPKLENGTFTNVIDLATWISLDTLVNPQTD